MSDAMTSKRLAEIREGLALYDFGEWKPGTYEKAAAEDIRDLLAELDRFDARRGAAWAGTQS